MKPVLTQGYEAARISGGAYALPSKWTAKTGWQLTDAMASARLLLAVLLGGIVTASALAQPAAVADRSKPSEMTTWAKGTVRDEAGQPVMGAKVYARATYYGSIRMYGLLHSAMTGTDGRYVVEGEKNLASFSASLVAHEPRRPPAFAWVQSESKWDETGMERREVSLPKGDIDFVIPGRGGKMEVLVTRGGQPASDVGVTLRLQGADPFDSWGLEHQTEFHKALYAICRPVRRTGPDGIARFDALAPGLYSIFAAEGDDQNVLGFTEYTRWFPFGDEPTYGEARDIPVRVGQTTAHRLAMFRHGCVTKFSILRDGKDWIAEEQLIPRSKSLSGNSEYSPTWIGKEWTDTFRFERSGLKEVSFVKYDVNGRSRSVFPFDSADCIIAASPRLSNTASVALVATKNHRESASGSVLVRMLDAEGMPISGSARAGNAGYQDVTLNGARFTGLQPGFVTVQGHGAGIGSVFPGENMVNMPAEERLVGRFEPLSRRVTVRKDEEAEVTLRYEKVGYVRGRLRPAEGQITNDYHMSVAHDAYRSGAGVFYRRDTGEFVAGPYRSGNTTLYVASWRTRIPLYEKEVRVQAGQVTVADLDVPQNVAELSPRRRMLSGQVLLSDGRTPAHLAAVARHTSADDRPWGVGMTDNRGKIWPHSVWVPFREDDPELPGTPREPYVAAWLPGQCGVTIVPMPEPAEQPLRITLPPAISMSGKVRVEGDGETVDNGTIRVRAQHEGRGKLDDLLSVETTAGADGAFELAGLTPGRYRVQAALDGIWLSESVAITAGDKTPEFLALTIPAPGGPVQVRLSGLRGDAGPTKLFVTRPTGPLTERLWPTYFMPDGAGIVRIPALEAGEHTIRAGEQSRVVTVSPLTQSGGSPLEISLERSDAKPR